MHFITSCESLPKCYISKLVTAGLSVQSPGPGSINLGEGSEEAALVPSSLTTTELPLSKAVNPICTCSSWAADQTVVVLGQLPGVNVWNYVNVIRVFLEKRTSLLIEIFPE